MSSPGPTRTITPLTESPVRYTFERRGRGPHGTISPEQWEAFLDELRNGPNGAAGNQVLAARAVGISFGAVYRRRQTDYDFNIEVEIALQQAGHVLLEAAWARAIEKSDPLMLRLLEGYLPGMFSRERHVDVQVTHRAQLSLTPEERAAIEPIKRRLLLAGTPGYVDDAEWHSTPSDSNTEPDSSNPNEGP